MKVISRDAGASEPRREGWAWAELLNSSLALYPSLTVCARFLSHHFSAETEGRPTPQSLISHGTNDLFSSFVARPCDSDQSYKGCTKDYKDIFSRNNVTWIRGKAFGCLFISGRNFFYPAWLPAVWNTACLSASPGLGRYRMNINGLTVLEITDFTGHLFESDKVENKK